MFFHVLLCHVVLMCICHILIKITYLLTYLPLTAKLVPLALDTECQLSPQPPGSSSNWPGSHTAAGPGAHNAQAGLL